MIVKKIKSLIVDYLKSELGRAYIANLESSLALLTIIFEESKQSLALGNADALDEFSDRAIKVNESLSLKNIQYFFDNRYLIALLNQKDKDEFLKSVMEMRQYIVTEYSDQYNEMNMQLYSMVVFSEQEDDETPLDKKKKYQ
ncbi:hypothetical protein UFOVP724_52 [uncultured Caudovirales phage]|uniref:Uncharacterized protein n=1 Tax=uncultured Caudovirales phage TaxID=2100421 RepID=A0A6J5NQT2_9CAUD|nr:hypothetical protein UFOVP724_52 [uncultured Caudovirales phage]